MTEQEEFEFRLRLEQEKAAPIVEEEVPFELQGMSAMGNEPTAAPSMFDYLLQSAGRGLTGTAARLASGSAAEQGTFAGAFPSQPELEQVTTESIQKDWV